MWNTDERAVLLENKWFCTKLRQRPSNSCRLITVAPTAAAGYDDEDTPSMRAELPKRLFTVDEYYRMAEVGILDPDARVELLEGEIVEMNPVGVDLAIKD
jgi:hypothetical protein